jgi:hypothetical protein
VPDLCASGNRPDDVGAACAVGIDFPSRAGQTRAAIVQGGPRTIDATSLFCFQRAALCLHADCVERKEVIMVRFVRLLAAAAFAAALASAAHPQGVPLEEGPLETGPLQSGPTPAAPKAKLRQTALKKRAKHAEPAGRQITVHARPSYLTGGTQVPVGSVGNGYVYDTFNQPTPIEGTFSGMRGRERLTDQFGNAASGLTLFKF